MTGNAPQGLQSATRSRVEPTCRHQEQSSGACIQAPSQRGAQSDCWHSPHQLVDCKLAGTNKADAACQVKSPTLGILPLVRLPFL
jgi:hypothetical protein